MADLSALRKQVHDLDKKRTDAVSRVLNTKQFIAAQVYERHRKCGKPNCKCAKGELHGPYLWVYQNKKGRKVISATVAEEKSIEAKELARRYEKLLRLRKQIRDADRKINELLNEYESHLEKEASEYVSKKGKS
jgi:hypothetical protein